MLTQQDLTLAHRQVGDIMETQVVTVASDMPLPEAARFMWEREISGAPVIDPAGRPVGVISASDIVRVKGFGTRRAALVRDVMTHATFSVRRSTTVVELARFLTKANVHRALVIEDDELVGIVSMSDIVRKVAEIEDVQL